MTKWLVLLIGGALGAVSRYAVSGAVHQIFGNHFPYGTFVVNSLGCLLVGFLAVIAEEKVLLDPLAYLFLMVGFCGAFTTFSTFILETAGLLKDGESLKAFTYLIASVVVGFFILRVGVALGKAF